MFEPECGFKASVLKRALRFSEIMPFAFQRGVRLPVRLVFVFVAELKIYEAAHGSSFKIVVRLVFRVVVSVAIR